MKTAKNRCPKCSSTYCGRSGKTIYLKDRQVYKDSLVAMALCLFKFVAEKY